ADECPMEQRDHCEAFMEAAIVFCRTAIHRVKAQYADHPDWIDWWKSLLSDPDLDFICRHRDSIVKKAPGAFSQVVRVNVPFEFAADGYHYAHEHYTVRATKTLRRCVDSTERHAREADKRFGRPE